MLSSLASDVAQDVPASPQGLIQMLPGFQGYKKICVLLKPWCEVEAMSKPTGSVQLSPAWTAG